MLGKNYNSREVPGKYTTVLYHNTAPTTSRRCFAAAATLQLSPGSRAEKVASAPFPQRNYWPEAWLGCQGAKNRLASDPTSEPSNSSGANPAGRSETMILPSNVASNRRLHSNGHA